MPYDTPSPAYGTLSYHVATDPSAFLPQVIGQCSDQRLDIQKKRMVLGRVLAHA